MVLLTASLPSLKFAIGQIARLSNFNTNKKNTGQNWSVYPFLITYLKLMTYLVDFTSS